MIGLEENFRKWVIKEGKGKTSSRQLILAINKVCQDFYNGNTEKHWRILTKHIVSILIYYNECNNNEYYISTDDVEILQNHLNNNVLKYLKSSSEYKKNIFPLVQLSLIYGPEKYFISDVPLNLAPAYINAFQFIFNQLADNNIKLDNFPQLYALARIQNIFSGDLSAFFDKIAAIISDNTEIINKPYVYLHLQYEETPSKQVAKALWTFYKYLSEKSLLSINKESLHLGYDELGNLITCINKIYDNLMKIITIEQVKGNSPKRIEAQNGKDSLFSHEVAEALECSLAAFRKIKKQGFILPIKKNGRLFRKDDVNKFLETSLHNVCYPGVDYSISIPTNDKIRAHPEIWCTREKAANILRRNVSTIDSYKKENVLTYIEMAPNSAFFYLPELNKVAKILRLNPTRGLNSLKNILKNFNIKKTINNK